MNTAAAPAPTSARGASSGQPVGAAPSSVDDARTRRAQANRRAAMFTVGAILVAAVGIAPAFVPFAVFAAAVVVGSRWWSRSPDADIVVRRTLSSDEVEIGESVDVTVALTNRAARRYDWLDVRSTDDGTLARDGVDEAILRLQAAQSETMTWQVTATRRGYHRLGPTLMHASDPLGLFEQWALADDVAWLTVLPRVVEIEAPVGAQGAVAAVPVRRSLADDTSRFAGVRGYRRGDPLKRIHWRATARTGTLQTRLFEPTAVSGVTLAVDFSEATLASLDLTASPRGRSRARAAEEDLLITTAASIAAYVLRSGRRVALWSNGADAAVVAPVRAAGATSELDALDAARGWAVAGRPAPHVEIPPDRGSLQRGVVLRALARLVPGAGPSLVSSIAGQAGAFERDLVLVLVTPMLDERIAGAVEALRAVGLSVAVFWTCATGRQRVTPGAFAADTPVWRITCDADLCDLSGVRL